MSEIKKPGIKEPSAFAVDGKIVHASSEEVRPNILDRQVQNCPTCSSELTDGFGLAGGGYGPYGFCEKCQRVVYKIILRDDLD